LYQPSAEVLFLQLAVQCTMPRHKGQARLSAYMETDLAAMMHSEGQMDSPEAVIM